MKGRLLGRVYSYSDIESELHVCWCLCFKVILHPKPAF